MSKVDLKQLFEDHPWDFLFAGAFLACTALVLWLTKADQGSDWMKGLAIAWAILPPVYFLYQWARYAPTKEKVNEKRDEFERFKLGQERARDLWLAGAGLLAAIVLKG